MDTLFSLLAKYHRYKVVGFENLPVKSNQNYLFIGSHSFATYDSFLFAWKVYQEGGRMNPSVANKLFFKLPRVHTIGQEARWIPGVADKPLQELQRGKDYWMLPGGMKEALRPSTEKRKVMWRNRKGFIRLSLKSQVPIVLFACPSADNIFTLYPNPATEWFYEKFSIPLPVLRGFGFSAIPRPTKLITYVAEPIFPPPIEDPEPHEQEIDQFHALVMNRMDTLLRGRI